MYICMHSSRHTRPLSIVIVALLLLAGCRSGSSQHPYSTAFTPPRRDTHTAQRRNAEGLQQIEKGDYKKAEESFRAALDADLFYASAHNNLGLVLLKKSPYEAAWEFQFSAKLLPNAAEPRNNLGLVFEHVGNLDGAIAEYKKALKIDPNNVQVMGHLARAYVKSGEKSDDLRKLLKRLAFQNPGGTWDQWARRQLLTLGAEK